MVTGDLSDLTEPQTHSKGWNSVSAIGNTEQPDRMLYNDKMHGVCTRCLPVKIKVSS